MPKGMPGDYPPKDDKKREPAIDALVDALGTQMNEAAGAARKETQLKEAKAAYARDKKYEERAYAETTERHEREAAAHAERLAAAKENLMEGKARREAAAERKQEIRDRLEALESQATSKNVEAEAVALEAELRELEGARRATLSLDRQGAEVGESERDASYEGKPNFPVPAVTQSATNERGKKPLLEAEVIPLRDLSSLETPKEHREAQRDLIARIEDAPKQSVAPVERKAMQESEKAYLNAYRELEQKRTLWNRLAKGKELGAESEKVDALKRQYDEARVTYANALTRSAGERLDAKGAGAERKDAVLDRYNRLVRFNEVIRPAAERRIKARQEALNARGKSALDSALAWSAQKNKELETLCGKNGARAVRALAGTVLVAGGAAAAGSFGTASLLAIAGWGTVKFARSFGAAVVGAAAGQMTGAAYEKFIGRKAQQAAAASLKSKGRNSAITLDALSRIDESREKLSVRADEATLEKKKLLVKALTAFGIGAGTAAALAELTAVENAADAALTTATDTPAAPEAPEGLRIEVGPVPEPDPASTLESLEASLPPQGPAIFSPEAPIEPSAATPAEVPSVAVDIAPTPESPEGKIPVDEDPVPEAVPSDEVTETAPAATVEQAPEAPASAEAPATESVPETAPESINEAERATTADLNRAEFAKNEAELGGAVDAQAPEAAESAPSEAPMVAIPEEPQATLPVEGAPSLPDIQESDITNPHAVENMPAEPSAQALTPEQTAEARNAQAGSLESNAVEDSSPAQASETFRNARGLEIVASEPLAYEMEIPGVSEPYVVAYGGTFEERFSFAKEYVSAHPGSFMMFDASYVDQVTQQTVPAVGGFQSDSAGGVSIAPGSLTYPDGSPLTTLDPDNLVRKLT